MNLTKEQLEQLNNASAEEIFESHEEEEEKVDEEPVEQKVEEQVSASTEEEDAVADKARVPYSRFESVHERAIRAEERLKLLEEQQAQSRTTEVEREVDLPEEWVELLGDSDAARRAYELQLRLNERIQETAAEKALERIQNREREEKEILNKNLEEIDNSLNEFSESLGRKLTESEESSILDIQDEFTPKGEDGKYIAPLLSPDKAYEIYTLRQGQAKLARTQAKNKVVSITSANSEGETSNSSADYNPQQWGSWRSKL